MKRFVNFRPLLYMFITFAAASFCVVKAFLHDFIPICIFGTIFLILFIFCIISVFKRDFLRNSFEKFGVKSLKTFCIMIFITAITASSITALSFAISSKRTIENGRYLVDAKVKEVQKIDNNFLLLLGNVKIEGDSQNFNIKAKTSQNDISVGNELEFYGYVSRIELVEENSINSTILKTNTQYYCYIDDDTLQVTNGNPELIDGIKSKTKKILQNYMSDENAGFSYTVLVGDKSLLSDEYYSLFKNAGLAHILAVSGLHIGFLVAILQLILKLCKMKSKPKFFIIMVVLVIYNILCNFSPSVFRASVMSLCLLLGLLVGERNDTLSNLSLAGIVVLLTQPLYLFDVGFLLSFSSVFGILFFSKSISNILNKIRLQKTITSAASVTISATLGSLPFVCKYFGEFAPISLLSNLVVLPLFSLMFAVLLICVFLNLLINLPILIGFSEFFVKIITNLSAIFSKAGTIRTLNFDIISVIIYYIASVIISHYFMISTKGKLICSLALVVCISGTLAVNNLSVAKARNSITTTKSESNSLLFTTQNGSTILTGVDGSEYRFLTIKNMLREKQIQTIDYLILYNYSDAAQNHVSEIANNYDVKNVFVFGDYGNSTKIGLTNALYNVNKIEFTNSTSFEVQGFSFERFIDEAKTLAISYNLSSISVLHILQSVSKNQIDNNQFFTKNQFDYLIANRLYDRFFEINSKSFVTRDCSVSEQTKQVYVLDSSILWTAI